MLPTTFTIHCPGQPVSILDHCWQSRDANHSDLQLVCRDGTLRAHRFIVACASNFVKELLLVDEEESTLLLPGIATSTALEALRRLYLKSDARLIARILYPASKRTEMQAAKGSGVNKVETEPLDRVKQDWPVG